MFPLGHSKSINSSIGYFPDCGHHHLPAWAEFRDSLWGRGLVSLETGEMESTGEPPPLEAQEGVEIEMANSFPTRLPLPDRL